MAFHPLLKDFHDPDQPHTYYCTGMHCQALYMHTYVGSAWSHYGMTAMAMFTVRFTEHELSQDVTSAPYYGSISNYTTVQSPYNIYF